tara:strand:+ start:3428 stop:3610 length:183 start_codon:yes stop_codon:yes gene_type:complete
LHACVDNHCFGERALEPIIPAWVCADYNFNGWELGWKELDHRLNHPEVANFIQRLKNGEA